ncbi:MAG: glycosyltransferase, partial [bacterium]
MRIGIDARALFGQHTGVGRFLSGALEAMTRDDRGHEFILYSPRPISFHTPNPRWRIAARRRIPGTNGMLWLQIYGPWLAWRGRLDVFWGPMFHLPVLMPPAVPGVVTVHDLVHLRFPQTMDRRNYLGLKTLMPPSLWRARHITADSQATADDLRRYMGISADKVSVVYPGIGREFHPRDPE